MGEYNRPRQTAAYLSLLALQIAGALVLTWNVLPAFKQVLINPGEQPQTPLYGDLYTTVAVAMMQGAYWYRLRNVSLPPLCRSNVVVRHVFQFLGRVNFIFGASVFSVVFFRHLPELGPEADMRLLAFRALLLSASLFSLFCLSIELDRLGNAPADNQTH
jgi:hypothetical protein